MPRTLPERPSLSSLRNQAKSLLRAARTGDPESRARIDAQLPNAPQSLALRHAQLAIAREYGFASWPKLKAHVDGAVIEAMSFDDQVDAFLDHACLRYDGSDTPRRIRHAKRLLERAPAVAEANVWTAAVTGRPARMRELLADDASLATARGGPRDWDPLLYLCWGRVAAEDPLGTARLLIEHGATPDTSFSVGPYRFTALTGAMGEGEAGPINQPPHAQAEALARLLLDAGADPNDGQGLYDTCFTPGNEWIELLLSYGLSKEHRANWQTDPPVRMLDFLLAHAAKNGFGARVELLLAHGADANVLDPYDGRPAYHNALLTGHPEIARLLADHGADPGELSAEDRLLGACMRGDADEARALLAEDPARLESNAPLRAAADAGSREAVELLLELGADVHATAADGSTALHRAAWRGDLAMVRLLLARGARLDVRDHTHGGTPAGWATHAGHKDVVELLENEER